MPRTSKTNPDDPVIIKKYANRRLYDTGSSSYITLQHLSEMTRAGREFKVVDAKSGEDITHTVLTQIIVEEESRGATLLPVSFLRQLIAMYGDQMQAMVPHYLEASMQAFRRNQEQARQTMMDVMTGNSNPFEALAKQNMAMVKAATDLWKPRKNNVPEAASADRTTEAGASTEEVRALRAELRDLRAKIDKLSGE